ncbi:MAG: alpha/beta hydrolase-fold protein [Phocaeicola sp.]|nr:alpha/beta hydrolase-fold protein [Phocaeicola sp.]MDD7447745.1 alpha/beta hydrolase-fold protein [Prevotellaceae bacterium]MDY3914211.1 alpha/beta hydrolase-fold protein [Phocaeicola sp.]MDY5939451.1 alpha/beta hydrolase-fold protein [Phocaeicola sp.]
MRKRNIRSLLGSAFLVLLAACSDNKDIPQPGKNGIESTKFLASSSIVSYYKAQLDMEKISNAPEQMYREYIKPEKIKEVRAEMWNLWKTANEERIAKAELSTDAIGSKPVWKIPQDEDMKIAFFAKGKPTEKGYPMILQLHGGGSYPDAASAWGSSVNEGEWYGNLSLAREYEDAPSFYMVPRMADDRKGRWYYAPQVMAFRKAIQVAVLSGIVDPDRIYLTGISEGGYGSLRLALFMPDYWAAVGPMAAAIKATEAVNGLRNIAFRLKVGEHDSTYGRNYYAYQWQDYLAKLQKENPQDFVHEVIVEKGKAHGVEYNDMTPWLIKHTRRSNPLHVSYVYHNLAADANPALGMFSLGVYNLDFRQLQADHQKAQLGLEVVRTGNTFDIRTNALSGSVTGSLGLYVDDIDFAKAVKVILNGHTVFDERVAPSRGVMAESIALFGDPKRIYTAKITIKL